MGGRVKYVHPPLVYTDVLLLKMCAVDGVIDSGMFTGRAGEGRGMYAESTWARRVVLLVEVEG